MAGDLERLERLRAMLAGRGVDATRAVLELFTSSGADPELKRVAARRDDVIVVDLPALYGRRR